MELALYLLPAYHPAAVRKTESVIVIYSKSEHELTGMTYRKGHYIVMFSKDGDNIRWDVDYLLNVYDYNEFDVKLESE